MKKLILLVLLFASFASISWTQVHYPDNALSLNLVWSRVADVNGELGSVESVEFSGNLIVVKTNTGAANYVAESLDNMDLEEIIGTVAGDNTILVVVKESASSSAISKKLKSLFLFSFPERSVAI